MEHIERKSIDWEKTGKNLQILRAHNMNLIRQVCYELNYDEGECSGDCCNCRYDIDINISRAELAQIFNVSESVVTNWESGRTPVSIEDMLLYCQIAKVTLEDIIVYE